MADGRAASAPDQAADSSALSDIATNGALLNRSLSGLTKTLARMQNIVLPVANGGTGAITAALARTNIGIRTGSFTTTAAITNVIPNTAVTATSVIVLIPTNAVAATTVGSIQSPYVSALSAGVSFTVTTANATVFTAAGNFTYILIG